MNDGCNALKGEEITGNINVHMRSERHHRGLHLVFACVTWEEIGLLLLLLRRIARAGTIRLVVRWGQERIADVDIR